MTISGCLRSSSSVTVRPAKGWSGRRREDHLVAEERLERDAALPPRGADDPELELARGDVLDDRVRVGHRQRDLDAGILGLELAEEQRQDDRGRAGRGTEVERSRELALADRRDVLQQLILEREHPLRAPIEPPAGLGRLDPAAGTVEQLPAEPLLESPDLEADGGLRDPEALRRLREALPLDDRAKRSELSRIHKHRL